MLNDDVLALIAATYDENQLLDALDLTMEDLVVILSDRIEDNLHVFEDVL